MTPKQAVSLVNRKAIRPERLSPTFAQVEAFLVADGWTMVEVFWDLDSHEKLWHKAKTPGTRWPHEIQTPVDGVRDKSRRISEILETIALMKGDRWAVAQIRDIIAKIEVK